MFTLALRLDYEVLAMAAYKRRAKPQLQETAQLSADEFWYKIDKFAWGRATNQEHKMRRTVSTPL